ncbi:MAG: hypothetical protein M9962_04100 [Oligoflexia bacterium]|nr:hypothetical protein [Oligoflexia bacterium]
MTTFLIFISVAFAQANMTTGTLNCKAIHRTLDQNNRDVVQTKEIPIVLVAGNMVRYQVDLEGKSFSILEDVVSGELLAQLTLAPDYTKGSVVRGSVDATGRFNLSEVDGTILHKMECKKISPTNQPKIDL